MDVLKLGVEIVLRAENTGFNLEILFTKPWIFNNFSPEHTVGDVLHILLSNLLSDLSGIIKFLTKT